MISGKIIIFLCLVAFWKIVWKIFYSVWCNVKKKQKEKPTISSSHHKPTKAQPFPPPATTNPTKPHHKFIKNPIIGHHIHHQPPQIQKICLPNFFCHLFQPKVQITQQHTKKINLIHEQHKGGGTVKPSETQIRRGSTAKPRRPPQWRPVPALFAPLPGPDSSARGSTNPQVFFDPMLFQPDVSCRLFWGGKRERQISWSSDPIIRRILRRCSGGLFQAGSRCCHRESQWPDRRSPYKVVCSVRKSREGVDLCEREDWGWVCATEMREGVGVCANEFWKMVYEKFFRKPFSIFYLGIFRSKDKRFPLTFILQRNKRPKMMKIFYGKRFTSKQTEP